MIGGLLLLAVDVRGAVPCQGRSFACAARLTGFVSGRREKLATTEGAAPGYAPPEFIQQGECGQRPLRIVAFVDRKESLPRLSPGQRKLVEHLDLYGADGGVVG
jgi:hypothetical protein